ncbi:putative bifunctional diguanylate cyclase/phosphodiesterase [Paenibacillus flagellatus]|uniref:Response regulator receiver protein n=1 Tax=Paenibacillus flagellatus TaxID=2211139 RepID=A0A2V5KVL4_9BACL|nr:EAL domain-containing protein [Paenibacillus flagellatus]PYI56137.1 response regulator receiver protein [Paenibacillus flagellatus]
MNRIENERSVTGWVFRTFVLFGVFALIATVVIYSDAASLIAADDRAARYSEARLFAALLAALGFGGLAVYAAARSSIRRAARLLEAERKRLEMAETFRRSIAVLPNAVYRCEKRPDGRAALTYHEGATAESTGLTTDAVAGRAVADLFPPAYAGPLVAALEKAFQGERAECDAELDDRIYHHVVKPIRSDDGAIREAAGYATDVTERRRAEEQVRRLAYTDSLTGLPNRVRFREELDAEVRRAADAGRPFAVLLIDLDDFKQMNETEGHDAGDGMLVSVAERLKAALPPACVVARLGADEFAVLLREGSDRPAIDAAIRDVRAALTRPFRLAHWELAWTASIGVSLYPVDGPDGASLLVSADLALNRAKSKGKDGVEFHTPDMDITVAREVELHVELRKALDAGRFELFYQPQTDLRTGALAGVEALVRWNDPVKGYVPPSEFIRAAEESGLIERLGEWTIEEACRQTVRWKRLGLPPVRMSVNLSARQFRGEDLYRNVRSIVRETGADPRQLLLEITESVSMQDVPRTIRIMNELRGEGIRFAIDDFGTGYSSLQYLRSFPVRHLKIDRSFVTDLLRAGGSEPIVKSILDMAGHMGLDVVAEGVETEEQCRKLRQLGCGEAQGFWYSRPLPEAEATAFLCKLKGDSA